MKIKWGVIGAGGIADRRTIPGMMLCDNAELIAVMEINEELAEKCRAKWGCKKAYDNEADLLADPEIDALVAARTAAKKAKNFAEADRIRAELKLPKNAALPMVATGGLAELVLPACTHTMENEPDLTLLGLYFIYKATAEREAAAAERTARKNK